MTDSRRMPESPPHQPASAVALMYHALACGATPPGQDPHYTLGEATFRSQLRSIARAGGAGCARDWLAGACSHRILLTFDDGHGSNAMLAMPALREFGMSADFFVNPATIGKRGFMSWADVRTMHAAGMSIQSHGYDHVYLTRLGSKLRPSLVAARKAIEDEVGAAVTLLAPPGGRAPADIASVAEECGYLHVLGSRPGRLSRAARKILPRMSVTAATSQRALDRWISGRPDALWMESTRYAMLAGAKRLLGDQGYERMRAAVLPAQRS